MARPVYLCSKLSRSPGVGMAENPEFVTGVATITGLIIALLTSVLALMV